jgi:quercetin dioxygenase-like cupin family protein
MYARSLKRRPTASSAHTGNQGAAVKDILNMIPAQEGVRAIKRGEGKPFDLGPVHFKWKVRGEDSTHTYTMVELHLAPGGGVDLHSHSSPETYYVLEGEVTFFYITNGEQEALVCDEGTTVMIPSNALHALFNKSDNNCRLLDVSTASHQYFFDSVAQADQQENFGSLEPRTAFRRLSEIARNNEMHLVPYDVNTATEIK